MDKGKVLDLSSVQNYVSLPEKNTHMKIYKKIIAFKIIASEDGHSRTENTIGTSCQPFKMGQISEYFGATWQHKNRLTHERFLTITFPLVI